MIGPIVPMMSAASAATIGALLGPIGTLALAAVVVALAVLIVGLSVEQSDLAPLADVGGEDGRRVSVDAA